MRNPLRVLPSSAKLRSAAAQLTTLRWAALPVTDRRWAAPLSAAAVGMGLFIGVAIGPGVEGTLGTAVQVVPPTESTPGGEILPPEAAPDDTSERPGSGGSADTAAPPPEASTPSVPPATSPTPTFPTPAPTTDTPTTPPTDLTVPPADEEKPEQPEDEPLTLAGTVVHLNPPARSYTLAAEEGKLSAIHTRGELPEEGTRLEVEVRELANGTFAERGERDRGGRETAVTVRGQVTFREPDVGVYTLSRRGVSMLVHTDRERGGSRRVPEVGAMVTVDAKLGKPGPAPPPAETPPTTETPPAEDAAPTEACGKPPKPPRPPDSILTQTGLEVDNRFRGHGDFEGIVQGVCRATRDLILSADDLRQSGADLTFAVGDEIRLGPVEPGQVVGARATIGEDHAALALTELFSDAGIKGADDSALAQGDEAQGDEGSGEQPE